MNLSNSTNITIIQPNLDKSFDIMFIILITVISIGALCFIGCCIVVIIANIIKLFILYLYSYNNHIQDEKKTNVKYIYDVLFGSLSLPVLTDVVIVNIDNNS
jgi:hypothetical protein